MTFKEFSAALNSLHYSPHGLDHQGWGRVFIGMRELQGIIEGRVKSSLPDDCLISMMATSDPGSDKPGLHMVLCSEEWPHITPGDLIPQYDIVWEWTSIMVGT
jgi:hypothetical protein